MTPQLVRGGAHQVQGRPQDLKRVLVTGGAGFIGSHTVDLLLSHGKEIVVLDNLSSGKMTNLDLSNPNLEFIEGDVLEFPLLIDLLANCDAVLHLAAIASVQLSIEDPIYSFQVNTQGFLHVLQAIRQVGRPIRLVYASSAAVYGNDAELPCRDDQRLAPGFRSPYALQKIHDEDYAESYQALHNIPSLALRYFNVYGERQDPASPYSGVISRFIDAYQKNMPFKIFGDGKQSRDFIHISDVARANFLALENEAVGAFNIATGKPETLLSLIKAIETAGGRAAQVEYEPARAGDIKSSYAAIGKAKAELGFEASLSLQDGVKQLMKI